MLRGVITVSLLQNNINFKYEVSQTIAQPKILSCAGLWLLYTKQQWTSALSPKCGECQPLCNMRDRFNFDMSELVDFCHIHVNKQSNLTRYGKSHAAFPAVNTQQFLPEVDGKFVL